MNQLLTKPVGTQCTIITFTLSAATMLLKGGSFMLIGDLQM